MTSKAYEGGLLDKTSVKDLFEAYTFPSKTLFLIDMGFYSEENIGLFRQDGKHFVIPAAENTIVNKAIRSSIIFDGEFIYEKKDDDGHLHNDIIKYKECNVKELENLYQEILIKEAECKTQESGENCKAGEKPKNFYPRKIKRSEFGEDRVIMFRDGDMHDKMVQEFCLQIGMDDEHTEEKLSELSPEFGLIV